MKGGYIPIVTARTVMDKYSLEEESLSWSCEGVGRKSRVEGISR